MGTCFLHSQSGGSGIELRVLSGAAEPGSAEENTLWVQTETAVSDYVLSPEQPEDTAEGSVWFRTIGEGFNYCLDKKGKLRVNIYGAYQYRSGAWKAVTVFVRTDGTWVELVSRQVYLYDNGDQFTDVTGGWGSVGSEPFYTVCTQKKVNVTGFQTLKIYFNAGVCRAWKAGLKMEQTANEYESESDWVAVAGEDFGGEDTVVKPNATIDVSGVSGAYYVLAYAFSYREDYVLDAGKLFHVELVR